MTSTLRYGSSNLPQPRSYDTTHNVISSRARDVRSEEDPDKHNQGGHDDRRDPEGDPGGRVLSQQRYSGYQAQIYLSGTRPDAGSAARGSYTVPTLSYAGYPNTPVFYPPPPAYQSPNFVHLDRPSGRHYQEDDPSQPYKRPQYNQEKSMIGGLEGRHDQALRYEPPPPSSRSRTDRTESLTKQSALRSGRGPNQRVSRSDTDDDEVDDDDGKYEEREHERVLFFIPSEGINKDVLDFYLKQYLGRDSDVEQGVHPRDRDVDGYFIRSRLGLSAKMVGDLKEDSRRWKEEKKRSKRGQLSYSKSDTATRRLEMGPSGRPAIR